MCLDDDSLCCNTIVDCFVRFKQDMQFTIDENLKKLIFKELEDRGLKVIELETVFLIVGVLRQKEHKLMEEGEDDY